MLGIIKKIVKKIYHEKKGKGVQINFSANVSFNCSIGKFVKIFNNTFIGVSEIGSYTYIWNDCNIVRTTIGPFCSIGPYLLTGLGSHPTNYVSTYPGFYSSQVSGATFFGYTHDFATEDKKHVKIGADVWIGARVTIIGGIEIGTGAIIATGAIVTKNVPPYAIVGGVPAKIIKYRFNESLIDKLLKSRWWELSEKTLIENAKYANNPELFINKITEGQFS
jgi:acetyltransferase-like isoleucine patch superfamily enzyme